MHNIVAVGSVAFDTVKTPVGSVEKTLGGSLTHFINASSLIDDVSRSIIGVVGNDFSPENESFFSKRKIDTTDLQKISDGKTFFWEGYYKDDMNEAFTVTTELNVFAEFSPRISDMNKNTDIHFLGNIDPGLQLDVLNNINSKISFMDTMNFWLESQKEKVLEVFKKVDGLIINEGEAFILTGEKNFLIAAEKIIDMGIKYLIIKRGNAGVTFYSKDGMFFSLPAFPIKNLTDPTGAGDSFAGGFVTTLAKKLKTGKDLKPNDFKEALVFGTIIASFNVENFGVSGIADKSSKDLYSRIEEFSTFSSFPKIN